MSDPRNARRGKVAPHRPLLRPALLSATVLLAVHPPQPTAAQEIREVRDIVFATVDGLDLALDLYLPAGVTNPPLVVWVHGGAWRSGTKFPAPMEFVRNGFATASLDFRQSTQARFPAQIHDIKAAIRFLRAHASDYGYRTDSIAIAGSSSGGHLVALVGVTNGHPELEGSVGGHFEQSSSVQAVLSYYGASNLTSILTQSTPFGLGVREPALELLLGGLPDANEETRRLARLASPVFHVDAGDPPIHLLHGDQSGARTPRRISEAGAGRHPRRGPWERARRGGLHVRRSPRTGPRLSTQDDRALVSCVRDSSEESDGLLREGQRGEGRRKGF